MIFGIFVKTYEVFVGILQVLAKMANIAVFMKIMRFLVWNQVMGRGTPSKLLKSAQKVAKWVKTDTFW